MTKDEAIKGLKVLRKDFSGYKPNEEMFDMAIEALSKCDKIEKVINSCEPDFLAEYVRGLFAE